MSRLSIRWRAASIGRALALCCAVAVAAACAPADGGRGGAPVGASSPTRIAATPGDTRLCAVVAPAEFARATGAAATQVTPGVTDDALTGLREVYCLYLNTTDAQQTIALGTINFELADDTGAATRIFQRVKQSFTGVREIGGVGDAAFSGTPGGMGTGTGLVVARGKLLLYLSTGGDAEAVVRSTSQMAALVLSRVTA